jgi:hypothetical protein
MRKMIKKMNTRGKYRNLLKNAAALGVVLAFVSVLFAGQGPCLCDTYSQYSSIEIPGCCHKGEHGNDHDCCGQCMAGVRHQPELLGISQLPVRFPGLQSSFVPTAFLPYRISDTRFVRMGPAFSTGLPAKYATALHIRSTVLLI